MERVDVAVVGGGPAGASAAQKAAVGGADVVFIERGVPRDDRESAGPDSTDAAGILDYWVELMDLDPADLPDGIILRELEYGDFIGPTEQVRIRYTGVESSYPHFGFTYDRTKFDDWLIEEAEAAGARYCVGVAVEEAVTSLNGRGDHSHIIRLRDGTEFDAEYLILADGPQRTVTMKVLQQFLPEARVTEALGPKNANHIAYQEYRQFPAEVFEPSAIKFWWGHMPGHTAYPWVFPNEETIARVGLTMPIDLDLEAVRDREQYKLLRENDERVPSGREYIRRLLEQEYGEEYDIETDFPFVSDRGKNDGTETYPISSTRPIDSPVQAGIVVTGGAMGATSAFHEGGGHLAVRTGKIAGELAARGALTAYNAEWKRVLGDEIRRNVAMADLVREYSPADWDTAFSVANRLIAAGVEEGVSPIESMVAAGWRGFKLAAGYQRRKFRYRSGRYVQIKESEYAI